MSKRAVLSSTFLSLTVVALVAFSASSVLAIPAFKDAFKAKYVKASSTAANDVALAAAVDQSGCAICHEGQSKKNRNAYGKELAKLISKRDKNNKEKINAAFEKVEKIKSKPSDPNSPTYGDKIADGKLPAQD